MFFLNLSTKYDKFNLGGRMDNCSFCNLDFTKLENTIIEETKNFYILPTLGSICEGYLLIIPKKHINSMSETKYRGELIDLMEKYRKIFFNLYGKYPIIFEHGTASIDSASSASITHAHIHIVNHNYCNEYKILNELKFVKVNKKDYFSIKNKSYIFYISSNNDYYISYNFPSLSQLMRIYIARDLNLNIEYNWRKFEFKENIEKTIKKLKTK